MFLESHRDDVCFVSDRKSDETKSPKIFSSYFGVLSGPALFGVSSQLNLSGDVLIEHLKPRRSLLVFNL